MGESILRAVRLLDNGGRWYGVYVDGPVLDGTDFTDLVRLLEDMNNPEWWRARGSACPECLGVPDASK